MASESAYQEFTGKSVEEALKIACETFKVGLADLDFEMRAERGGAESLARIGRHADDLDALRVLDEGHGVAERARRWRVRSAPGAIADRRTGTEPWRPSCRSRRSR